MDRVQIITDNEGRPAFAVIPYADYVALRHHTDKDLVPHAVVTRVLVDDVPPIRAWREHLGLTQQEVADRLSISQPAFAKQENAPRVRKATREKIAAALGIHAAQLDIT
ncbi:MULTISPECIES: helix-turn-helix domain-containing protein [Cupriavidus]|jgi:hypothetical protein|uniref:Transcriptional regulator, XRE-family n=2 Tax=Cupriavidus TaxID=106589 RepID=A0A7Z7NQK2_9BURK|nr:MULTISPECIES: helix-turn-helix transcriptional regulator [Cupriavidus]NOV27833.1 XRE family transcriptional regulator [Cupriavidus necator]NSX14011.1 helix-turn-helix transcriptional regulator [Cupriavidus taiwanensis]QEZ48646.1 XRE family transcriptional regulator [Cupriavidus oxalaticus]SOZ18592.1 Transcriptional regulator, XRE-family [Cupriavidus taiwanensis]SOZ96726.1 Transcriptional regulator, XRE-family [Cupriavidus taiwanensis]